MSASQIPHVSEEEENYLRMHLLMTGISSRAVRVLFDKEFPPVCLDAEIKKNSVKLIDLKKKRIINGAQWTLLFPHVGVPDSNTFDVTLMVALLRNLTKLTPPICGYDNLPLSTDTTPTADMARIKHYRNSHAHFGDGKITSTVFIPAWEDISGAVKRLGGPDMDEECNELRSKHLDTSTVPWNIRGNILDKNTLAWSTYICEQIIHNIMETISIKYTKTLKHDEICIQMIQILDQWQKDDANFVETNAARHALECIQENSCVTITASSGVGKTATLQHVVLKMADDGYNVLLITNPHDIVKFYNPNQKTLFVIDNFCGTYSINQSDLNNWEPVMKRIEGLIHKSHIKIIVGCRLQVYKDNKFESLSFFKTNVCNLLSENLCLSQAEKKSIAEMYLDTKASKIIQYSDLYACFPLLCKLYRDNTEFNITDFFQNPFSVYETEFEQLKKTENFGKYCALALCVMFNNRLKEEVLTEEIDKETNKIIKRTCQACRLDSSTSRLVLLDELDSLEHTFLKKEDGVYRTIHDKLFDFLSDYFGKMIIQCLIENAHSCFIMERFLLEREEDMDQFITVVPPKYHQMYIQRMINDWSKGNLIPVFCNKNIDNPDFRTRLLCYVKSLKISYQRQLAQTNDVKQKHNALLHCCFVGDIPLIQWCCYNGADVNQCSYDGTSPALVSSQQGDTEGVKLLLKYNADVNIGTNYKGSPLVMACQKNHVDIVKLLLEYNADVNKGSPLLMACQENQLDIVKLLLEYNADVNKCDKDDEGSPLVMACQENHVDIVKLLIKYKADVNGTHDNGFPLLMACQKNHVDIVKLLLEYKAYVNKGFPLLMACQENQVDIVKLLLEYNADVNKCNKDYEGSPLVIACKENHVDIVKLLIKYKADVNGTHDNGFPLLMACQRNHVDIVKLLLEYKADVNKGSPLLMACWKNHVDIVKLLLEYNADVNKCNKDDKISPLFIACQGNHEEIVKLLLDNNADINTCRNDETSPLFVACQGGFLNIVKMLLDNKADVNRCRENGESPILVATFYRHTDVIKMLLEKGAHYN